MISGKLKARLDPDRPWTEVTLKIPVDVLEETKELAEKIGFGSPQALMRFYIGQGLRRDTKAEITEESKLRALLVEARNGLTAAWYGSSLLARIKAALGES